MAPYKIYYKQMQSRTESRDLCTALPSVILMNVVSLSNTHARLVKDDALESGGVDPGNFVMVEDESHVAAGSVSQLVIDRSETWPFIVLVEHLLCLSSRACHKNLHRRNFRVSSS